MILWQKFQNKNPHTNFGKTLKLESTEDAWFRKDRVSVEVHLGNVHICLGLKVNPNKGADIKNQLIGLTGNSHVLYVQALATK